MTEYVESIIEEVELIEAEKASLDRLIELTVIENLLDKE